MGTTSGPAAEGAFDRLGRTWMRTRLFVLSYMPLLLIFGLQCTTWPARIGYFAAGAVVVVDGWRCTYGQRRKNSRTVQASTVRDKGSEVSGYLATYLLPFLSGPPNSWWSTGAYLVYFAVAWIVFVNSDLLFINPTLYVLGWKVIAGRVNEQDVLILAKTPPRAGEPFSGVNFAGGLVKVDG
ncbi:hypothetical protein ACP6C3_30475 [Mycolicibacterium septicum]|uniref:Uncharacterized protein n=5 Tax=Mycolicibacterium TaxID=1866885 RepID=A0A7X6RUJ9_9MYCO|nr:MULTISPECIES: hypothetical protein [Mycolicibacterium]MCV7200668.1 hypothetical protein [Mycolicibacterium peregrinum]MCW1824057.1 hypothetical protein [Mycolicibacterium senegalense]NKZ09997.1 hypothetical protein [Mycolicibacterium septicum DSM 44393]NOR04136.1 hypothetical protein [Mycolicibacterium fortuitum]QZH63717.1 hypothetical protein K6L26_16635 [Mycolicibacterium farcinogenes]